jgi:hypothetical protein
MTCQARLLSLPNQKAHALLAGLRMLISRPGRSDKKVSGYHG